jgi:hypothetical protein
MGIYPVSPVSKRCDLRFYVRGAWSVPVSVPVPVSVLLTLDPDTRCQCHRIMSLTCRNVTLTQATLDKS